MCLKAWLFFPIEGYTHELQFQTTFSEDRFRSLLFPQHKQWMTRTNISLLLGNNDSLRKLLKLKTICGKSYAEIFVWMDYFWECFKQKKQCRYVTYIASDWYSVKRKSVCWTQHLISSRMNEWHLSNQLRLWLQYIESFWRISVANLLNMSWPYFMILAWLQMMSLF